MAVQINFHGALVASLAICLEILLTLGFLGLLVFSNKLLEDFIPLVCCVFMCTAFIGTLGIPFILMLYLVKGKIAIFIYYSIIGLVIWNISVIKYLFEKILLMSPSRGLILAMSYFSISYAVPFLGLLVLL
jgi:hypothetical protein